MANLVKAFDRIQASGGSVFLASCRCDGDSCQCSDAATGDSIFATILNTKAQTMTKPLNLIETIRSASGADKHKFLDAISASAASLPAADLKTLIQALSAEVRHQETKTGKRAQRLARLQAATESTDPRYEDAQRGAASGLRRLGLGTLNAHCEAGIDVPALDAKMKAANWSSNERILLKGQLHVLGLIE
jgi:hypothetical protein